MYFDIQKLYAFSDCKIILHFSYLHSFLHFFKIYYLTIFNIVFYLKIPYRFYNSSSSSDIFPVSNRRDRKRGGGSSVISSSKSSVGYLRPTVHPQVVCDIPVKRLPYVVNFSSKLHRIHIKYLFIPLTKFMTLFIKNRTE